MDGAYGAHQHLRDHAVVRGVGRRAPASGKKTKLHRRRLFPSAFSVGGPSVVLRAISIIILIPGIAIWIWSVVLILTKVPKKELITTGPYSPVKHPLYTGVALLVLPWIGFLFNTWLGAVIGIVLYIGSRLFSPGEEKAIARAFGPAWEEYRRSVKIPS